MVCSSSTNGVSLCCNLVTSSLVSSLASCLVPTVLVSQLRTILPEMSRSSTLIANNTLLIYNYGSLSVWVNSNPIIRSLVSNLLTVSAPYSTQPFMVQLALVAVGERPNIPLSFIVPSRISSGYILPSSILPLEWRLLSTRSPVIPHRRVMTLALDSLSRMVDHSSSRHSSSDHSSPNLPITSAGPSYKRRRSPVTSVPALPPVSRALSPSRADWIPSPKRVRDIGNLADVEVDPRETRVERVTHPAMPEDIPEPAQEGAAEVAYETLGDLVQRFHDHTQAIPVHRIQTIEGVQREQGHRIVKVESAVTTLTERVAKLERDNQRLRGTAS
nr:hypothetical protein [Tanacetum cinerariifolium]